MLRALCTTLGSWRAPLRNRVGMFFSARDYLADIKCTVAGTKFIEIRVPVIAGADDVKIFCLYSRGKTTGAGTVPVTLLIFQ
jgi:hypothetical protein